jgi:hypothetical protein
MSGAACLRTCLHVDCKHHLSVRVFACGLPRARVYPCGLPTKGARVHSWASISECLRACASNSPVCTRGHLLATVGARVCLWPLTVFVCVRARMWVFIRTCFLSSSLLGFQQHPSVSVSVCGHQECACFLVDFRDSLWAFNTTRVCLWGRKGAHALPSATLCACLLVGIHECRSLLMGFYSTRQSASMLVGLQELHTRRDGVTITCACHAGDIGSSCNTVINDCDSTPCRTGASCKPLGLILFLKITRGKPRENRSLT